MATDPEQFVSQVMGTVREQIGTAAQEYGIEKRDQIKQSISVPVEYVGSKVIRSKQGEPRRQEFGDLSGSVTAETTIDGNHVRMSVFSDADAPQSKGGTIGARAAWLEKKLDRPHFAPVAEQMQGETADAVSSKLSF